MKAFEVPIRVTPDGKVEFPQSFVDLLPTDRTVRAIILVGEQGDADE